LEEEIKKRLQIKIVTTTDIKKFLETDDNGQFLNDVGLANVVSDMQQILNKLENSLSIQTGTPQL